MSLLDCIQKFHDILWAYLPILLILLGIYLIVSTAGAQFPNMFDFTTLLSNKDHNTKGVNPIKLVFAAAGGMIGIGNIIFPITAIKIAGAGSMLWLWVGSIIGMTVKYSEIYLSIQYRTVDSSNNYIGGIMYYIEQAFSNKMLSKIIAVFVSISLCIYGIEVFQFAQMVTGVDDFFEASHNKLITVLLLILLFYSVFRGVSFQAELSTLLIPIFGIGYMIILSMVLYDYRNDILPMFGDIFYSAFDLTSMSGGLVGSVMIISMKEGMTRSIYSGDIGVGLDAAIQSETSTTDPKKQAVLGTYALFMDTFICFSTMVIVYLTDTYHLDPLNAFIASCAMYIPHARIFVTILLLIAGFTTVLSVLNVGVKSSKYLTLKYGRFIYLILSIILFIISSDVSLHYLEDIMLLTGGITLLINMIAIFQLRKEIKF